MKYNSIKILITRSEIEPVGMQLIHKNKQKFSHCCCSLSRRFPTFFSFKKSPHLNLKKNKEKTLLFGSSSSQVNTKHTKNCKTGVWNMLGYISLLRRVITQHKCVHNQEITKKEDLEQDFRTQNPPRNHSIQKKLSGQVCFMLCTQVNVMMLGHLHRRYEELGALFFLHLDLRNEGSERMTEPNVCAMFVFY